MSVIKRPEFSVCERCTFVCKRDSSDACSECGHYDITLAAASILSEFVWDSNPKAGFRGLISAALFVADEQCGLPQTFDLYLSLDDGQNDYCAARSRNVALDDAAQRALDDIVAHQKLLDKKTLGMRPAPWTQVARDGTIYVRATAKYGAASKTCNYPVTGNHPFEWKWQLEHDKLMMMKQQLRENGIPKNLKPTCIQGIYRLPGVDAVFVPDPL